jgi:hypothetical protein
LADTVRIYTDPTAPATPLALVDALPRGLDFEARILVGLGPGGGLQLGLRFGVVDGLV